MSNRIPTAKAVPTASYETSETRGKLPAVPGIVLRTVITSTPRPGPVAAQPAVPVIPAEKFPPLDQSWSANTEYIAGWNDCRAAMLATAPEAPQTAAVRDVLAERQRQISVEGWKPEHDDTHAGGALIMAAVCYADWNLYASELPNGGEDRIPVNWPWAASWWKPSTPRRDLVKAGALILAEIERLDRAALASAEGGAA